jgi:hypothetical protein
VLTVRTELTDRMLIFGERHLRRVLAAYAAHYNMRPASSDAATSAAPGIACPRAGPPQVRRRRVLGGLINEYEPGFRS